MFFKQVIEVRGGFIAQSGGDFQNGHVGIGQQFFGVGELNTTPIRNDGRTHIMFELLLNIGIAIGDTLDKLGDLFVEIIGVLHRINQSVQPIGEISVQQGALVKHAGAEQFHNHGFANHQIITGRMFTRGLDIQTGFFNFRVHSVGNFKCKRFFNIQ